MSSASCDRSERPISILVFAKSLLVILAAPYVAWLIFAYDYHFIDGVNLAFHEAGHLFLGFFGETIHFLGGTLAQLFFPLACCAHFAIQRQTYEVGICLIWFAESLMNTARYLGDAEAQLLPLVGGHIHDWNWLLSKAGLLMHCEGIALSLHILASLVAISALILAARASRATVESDVTALLQKGTSPIRHIRPTP